MRCLLDAHALIWFVDQDHLLSPIAHSVMSNSSNDLVLSAATIWEIGIKVSLKKLPFLTKAVVEVTLNKSLEKKTAKIKK